MNRAALTRVADAIEAGAGRPFDMAAALLGLAAGGECDDTLWTRTAPACLEHVGVCYARR